MPKAFYNYFFYFSVLMIHFLKYSLQNGEIVTSGSFFWRANDFVCVSVAKLYRF